MNRKSIWWLFVGVVTSLIVVLVYLLVHSHVIDQVEMRVRDSMLECRAFHQYVQRDMHPAYYDLMNQGLITMKCCPSFVGKGQIAIEISDGNAFAHLFSHRGQH